MSSTTKKWSLYEYDKQIACAFKVDCEEFLEEFEKLKSFRYSDFAKVWQLKNFTFVFSGQKFALLLKELCENYFYIVKKFVMLDENIFKQIGAFYLLYGLYYKQPLKAWVKIRLTLDEYKKITELLELMKKQGLYEPIYIFSKMKVDQAFIYTALPRPLGPEDRFVKSYDSFLDYTFSSSKNEETLSKFNEIVQDGDLVTELEKTNKEYLELLNKFAASHTSLTPFPSNIMRNLQDAYTFVQQVESSASYQQFLEEGCDRDASKRKSVRQRAAENKNAVYRGNRKVKTAIDIDFGDSPDEVESDFDDNM